MEQFEIDSDVLSRIQNPVGNWAAQLHYSYTSRPELMFEAQKARSIIEYLVLNTNVIRNPKQWIAENPDLYAELGEHFNTLLGDGQDDPMQYVDEEIDIALPSAFL